jgi:hypothetical protein
LTVCLKRCLVDLASRSNSQQLTVNHEVPQAANRVVDIRAGSTERGGPALAKDLAGLTEASYRFRNASASEGPATVGAATGLKTAEKLGFGGEPG